MSWGDVAFDADLVANVLGDLAGAPALHAGDVELGKSAGGHLAMIAAENRIRLSVTGVSVSRDSPARLVEPFTPRPHRSNAGYAAGRSARRR